MGFDPTTLGLGVREPPTSQDKAGFVQLGLWVPITERQTPRDFQMITERVSLSLPVSVAQRSGREAF